MDDQTQNNDEEDISSQRDISLGAGVDIVPPDDADDIEIESYNDDTLSAGELTPQDRIKQLREKLGECKVDRQQYLDGWQRLKADFANYKRREEEEKGQFIKFAREGLINDLLPVLESFQMAFSNKGAWEKVDPSWRTGVEHIHTQLRQVLEGYGLAEVNPIGKAFDPSEHTSIGTVTTADSSKYHTIAEVLQMGYKLSGKLIKSPRVKVYEEIPPDATKTHEG